MRQRSTTWHGSAFYWYFADLDALKEAIAARWCEETRTVGIGFAHGQAMLPKPTAEEVDRLLSLLTMSVDPAGQ